MPLCGNIVTKRRLLGLTQTELANKINLSSGQLSRLETGSETNPKAKVLIALSKALSISIDELLLSDIPTNTPIEKRIERIEHYLSEQGIFTTKEHHS